MAKNSIFELKNQLNILKNQCKPTDVWQSYLDEEDDFGVFYTQEGVNEVSNALDQFIQTFIEMDDFLNTKFIEDAIHKIVVEINIISHQYEGMIETEEREVLVDFINSVLDTIEYDYNGDVTERWREW